MKILIVIATHGDEKLGFIVKDILQKFNPQVDFIVGNPKAHAKGVRYIESDLNRVFPGRKYGTQEEQRAQQICSKLKAYDLVIDVHSTVASTKDNERMIITTNLTDEIKNIIKLISPPRALVMKYRAQNSLIAQAKNGIAFEYGGDDIETALITTRDIARILEHYGKMDNVRKQRTKYKTKIYEVYDVYPNPQKARLLKSIQNFKEIKKGDKIAKGVVAEETFIPILFGGYKDIFGFKGSMKNL